MKFPILGRWAAASGLGALVLVLLLRASTTAFAASPARVIILETSPVDLPGLGANALTAGVATALQSKGAEVIPAIKLRTELLACTSPSCYVTIADVAGATHVLRIEGAYANDGYTLQVELWDSRTGKVARSERYHCDLCAPQSMVASARDQATLLWAQDSGTEPPAVVAPVLVNPRPATPTLAPEAPMWPWWLVGGGAALAAGGIVALVHGDSSSCAGSSASSCGQYRDYATPGVILVAGGAAVAAAGAGYLLYRHFRPESAAPVVAIGPGSILLEGRF
jgi:hypothetical protein